MTHLTHRELACLTWAAAGKTSAETGFILRISKRTVDYHIYNACRKLEVHNRRTAIALAIQMGLMIKLYRLLPRLPRYCTAPRTPVTQVNEAAAHCVPPAVRTPVHAAARHYAGHTPVRRGGPRFCRRRRACAQARLEWQ